MEKKDRIIQKENVRLSRTLNPSFSIKKMPSLGRKPLADLNDALDLTKRTPISKPTRCVRHSEQKSQHLAEVTGTFDKMPTRDRHFVTAEIKCFMSAPHKHDSHIMDIRIAKSALDKLKKNERFQTQCKFSLNIFFKLSHLIINKCSDSSQLLETFEKCVEVVYPPTVEFMLLYMGIFLFSISAHYEKAEKYCQKLFDLVVRFKVEEYFILFLFMKIKLKCNLSQWEDALRLLTKLLAFAWAHKLPDLEIWCYFQLSRAFFFLQREQQSQIFRRKSENNYVQPIKSIYREVCVSRLKTEIVQIWEGQLDFHYLSIVESSRLSLPENVKYSTDDYISDQRRLKTSIKSISQECRIRHANNLLRRVGQLGQYKLARQNEAVWNLEWTSGNNFLLTHQSFNKNMGMFFRPAKIIGGNQPILYTIENSQKNWIALREMLRNIFIEMNSIKPA